VGVFGFATNLTQLSGNGQSGILVWALKAPRRRITLAHRSRRVQCLEAISTSLRAGTLVDPRLGAAKSCAQSAANGFAPD